MRIFSINNNNSMGFKGLWGRTTRNTDIDRGLHIPNIRETRYYFPFLDESEEQINSVISNTNKAYIDYSQDMPKHVIIDCKRCITLPFKEQSFVNTYLNFNNTNKVTKKVKTINKYVKEIDLNLDGNFGKKQTSALNEIVNAKLDKS